MIRRPDPRRDQRGYTLVELVIAAGIFVVITVVVVGVLVSVLNSSSKVAAQRSVQQDIRVNVEEVARTARSSQIDYDFYKKAAAEGQTECTLPTNARGATVLPLFWNEATGAAKPDRKRVIFFFDDGAANDDTDGILYRYETDADAPTPSCGQLFASGAKTSLTTPDVATTEAKFFVSPLTDPYGSPCPGPVPNASCQLPRNTHPRVTMLITVQRSSNPTNISEQAEFSRTTIQTTVGTRAYPISGLYGREGS